MGNLFIFCIPDSKPQQKFDKTKYFRRFQATSLVESIISTDENIFKEMKVGIYAPHYRNQLVFEQWQHIIEQVDLALLGHPQDILQSTIVKENEISLQSMKKKEIKQDVVQEFQQKYKFISLYQDVQAQSLMIIQKDNFINLVMLGPPQRLRWSCWKIILLYKNPSRKLLYDEILDQEASSIEIIERDVQRTLISHIMYQNNGEKIGQHQLLRVLKAINITFPQIGYCQGMNFLAGFLLLVSQCDEKYSFQTLASLLIGPNNLMYYFYCSGMPMVQILCVLIHKLLRKHFPKIEKQLILQDIPDSLWIQRLAQTLFLDFADTAQALRIWDYLIARGTLRGLPEIILGLIGILEQEFEHCDLILISNLLNNKNNLDFGAIVGNAQMNFQIKDDFLLKFVNQYTDQKLNQTKIESDLCQILSLINQPQQMKNLLKEKIPIVF